MVARWLFEFKKLGPAKIGSQTFFLSPPLIKNPLLSIHSTTSRPESPPADASLDTNGLNSLGDSSKRQRKRREMQSITKVVETRDFPYNDEYLWKNNGKRKRKIRKKGGLGVRRCNPRRLFILIPPFRSLLFSGNTIHKGSGEKSIYYKCSNSSKVSKKQNSKPRWYR
jgi:hypothetical protein